MFFKMNTYMLHIDKLMSNIDNVDYAINKLRIPEYWYIHDSEQNKICIKSRKSAEKIAKEFTKMYKTCVAIKGNHIYINFL